MTAILYAAKSKLTEKHCVVFVPDRTWPIVYIRMEVLKASLVDALAMAKPMEGETVLNTIEL